MSIPDIKPSYQTTNQSTCKRINSLIIDPSTQPHLTQIANPLEHTELFPHIVKADK